MSKDKATTLNTKLTEVTKELDVEIADAKSGKIKMATHELTALKTWRGIIGRVALDLVEFGK